MTNLKLQTDQDPSKSQYPKNAPSLTYIKKAKKTRILPDEEDYL
jgi:hypothetical protein